MVLARPLKEAEPPSIYRSTVWRSSLQEKPCTTSVGWPTTASRQILLAAHKPVEKVVQSLFQGGRHRLVLPLGMLAMAHLKSQNGSLSPEARASCERRALSVPA